MFGYLSIYSLTFDAWWLMTCLVNLLNAWNYKKSLLKIDIQYATFDAQHSVFNKVCTVACKAKHRLRNLRESKHSFILFPRFRNFFLRPGPLRQWRHPQKFDCFLPGSVRPRLGLVLNPSRSFPKPVPNPSRTRLKKILNRCLSLDDFLHPEVRLHQLGKRKPRFAFFHQQVDLPLLETSKSDSHRE